MTVAKITKTESFNGVYVTTPDRIYMRLGPESWNELMGESWESVFRCDELEDAYQYFIYRGAVG